ncbi:MAG: phosphoribosylglycinamide formyltransferase [bacterium]|nr:phosphoribosylglycinamide formyltransferase [bacterium]
MTRIAVFASGRGSNFEALVAAERAGVFPGEIVLLLSDQPNAGALEIAAAHDIEGRVIETAKRRGRIDPDSEALYVEACRGAGVEWICLAGFMRIIGQPLLSAFTDRIVNIHPSLLPSFPGLDAQRQAWEYGVRVSGCTVHLVDAGMDTGPIILQQAVSVMEGESAGQLASRILAQEHKAYPEALRRVLTGAWHREGRRINFQKTEGESA